MAGNCSWEDHPGGQDKMCPGASEAPELYSRGFLTMEQIAAPPPPAVVNYVFLLLCLCGLVGNGLVLWFFSFSIKRSPFSIYFLHLAGADAGYLFSKAVLSILNTGGFLGTFAEYVRAVSRLLGLCTFVAGVSLLPAISAERCLSVIFPAWYWRQRPKRLSAVVCALLWTLSLLVTGIHNYFCVFLSRQASGGACRHMDVFLGVLLFLVFCPLMVLPCLALILHVECRARRRQRSAKLNHVILAVVSVFLVSSIYLGIDWFLFWVFQIPAPFPEYVTDMCICIHSSAKPVVYFLAGRDKSQRLWEPLRVVFQRALRDGAELGEVGGRHAQHGHHGDAGPPWERLLRGGPLEGRQGLSSRDLQRPFMRDRNWAAAPVLNTRGKVCFPPLRPPSPWVGGSVSERDMEQPLANRPWGLTRPRPQPSSCISDPRNCPQVVRLLTAGWSGKEMGGAPKPCPPPAPEPALEMTQPHHH